MIAVGSMGQISNILGRKVVTYSGSGVLTVNSLSWMSVTKLLYLERNVGKPSRCEYYRTLTIRFKENSDAKPHTNAYFFLFS